MLCTSQKNTPALFVRKEIIVFNLDHHLIPNHKEMLKQFFKSNEDTI